MGVRFPTDSDFAELLAVKPLIATTARGPVQYADIGEGPVLLSMHGSFGGWDYGLGMAAFFAVNGYRVVAPSRRGFLGSPLDTGISFEDQADTMSALLDELAIDRAAVMGFSIGGPPAYLLAARHPERTRALVQADAMCTSTHLTRAARAMWWLADHRAGLQVQMALLRRISTQNPARALAMVLAEDSTLGKQAVAELAARVLDDPGRTPFALRVLGTSLRRTSERFEGQRADDALILTMDPMNLSGVGTPTLLIGGTADKHRGHIEYAARAIPHAEVRWIRNGTHRGLWLDDDCAEHQAYVLDWLMRQAA